MNGSPGFTPLPVPERIDRHTWPEATVPLVVVRVTTYNHARFIRECIEGVLQQATTFPVRLVIHDDASTDGTAEIVHAYGRDYPRLIDVVVQRENQYSKGVPIAQFTERFLIGKYIAVCEGDDYWVDPTKLEKQVSFLESHPEFVIACHDAFIIDADGKRLADSKLPAHQKRDHPAEDLVTGRAFLLTLSWVYRNVLPHGPIPEARMIKNRDTFTVSRLGEHGGSKFHHDILPAAYRVHEGGVWSLLDPDSREDDAINTYFWMFRYYKRMGRPEIAEVWHRRWQNTALKRVEARRLIVAAIRQFALGRWLGRMAKRVARPPKRR